MTDTTDLIARLRDNAQGISLGAEGMGWGFDEAMLQEAADALEKQAAWQAALSAPPGYVMVPVEPTPEMAQALIDYKGDDELWWPTDVSPNYALAAYRVLIAAAPKEPT